MSASSFRRRAPLIAAAIGPGRGGGSRSSRVTISRTCATGRAGFFPAPPRPLRRQEPRRPRRRGHVVVPAGPAADRVVVQARRAAARLQHLRGLVARAAGADHRGRGDRGRRGAPRVPGLGRRRRAAADGQPFRRPGGPLRARGPHARRRHGRDDQRPLRPGADRDPLPPRRRRQRRPGAGPAQRRLGLAAPRALPRPRGRAPVAHPGVARHVRHGPRPPVAPGGAAGQDPAERAAGRAPAVRPRRRPTGPARSATSPGTGRPGGRDRRGAAGGPRPSPGAGSGGGPPGHRRRGRRRRRRRRPRQFSSLPSRPHHGRGAPPACTPFLGKPLGSTTKTAVGSAGTARTGPRNAARAAAASHWPSPTKCCTGGRGRPGGRWARTSSAPGRCDGPRARPGPVAAARRGSSASAGRGTR